MGYVSAMPGIPNLDACLVPFALQRTHVRVSSGCGCADAHVGKGVSIGTVFASERYIAPMAVGVDIGTPFYTHAEITCLLLYCPHRGLPAHGKTAMRCIGHYMQQLVLAGCGMCAVPFRDLHKDKLRLRDLQKIQRLIKERIPTGSAAHPPLSAPKYPMYAFRCWQAIAEQGASGSDCRKLALKASHAGVGVGYTVGCC